MQKKKCLSPELEFVRIRIREVICDSFEDGKSQVIDDGGWGEESGD